MAPALATVLLLAAATTHAMLCGHVDDRRRVQQGLHLADNGHYKNVMSRLGNTDAVVDAYM